MWLDPGPLRTRVPTGTVIISSLGYHASCGLSFVGGGTASSLDIPKGIALARCSLDIPKGEALTFGVDGHVHGG